MSKITLKTLNTSIEQLAAIMLKSFEAVDKRFDAMDLDLEDIKLRLDNKADRFELKELDKRVTRIETKVESKSK